MEFEAESVIEHPFDAAYRAYRDHLSDLVASVPNIERIEVHAREEMSGGIKLHNIWYADARIPRVAQTVISKDLMTWDDFAVWRDSQHVCDWELVPHRQPDRFTCTGHHTFERLGPRETRILVEGDLEVNLEGVRLLPSAVQGSVQAKIEEWITSLMVKNLLQINEALDEFLRGQE